MGDAKQACTIAKDALESAIEVIDECTEEHFQEAQSIIELLRENLNIWCEEVELEQIIWKKENYHTDLTNINS